MYGEENRMRLFITFFTILLLASLSLTGCLFTPSFEEVEPARQDLANDGSIAPYGEDGWYGSARITRDVLIRTEERVEVDIFVPFNATGSEPAPGPHPSIILVHGGLVPKERYHWMARHFATRGFITFTSEHLLNLALFEAGNDLDAYDRVTTLAMDASDPLHGLISSQPPAIMGHSLGGVVASKTWTEQPARVGPLVMLASIPAGGHDFANRPAGSRVLSVAGGVDGSLAPAGAAEGVEQMREGEENNRVDFVMVEGMNHYQWTDDATEDELAGDNTPTVTDEVARKNALFLIDALLEQTYNPSLDPEADILDEPMLWPPGLLTYQGWLNKTDNAGE